MGKEQTINQLIGHLHEWDLTHVQHNSSVKSVSLYTNVSFHYICLSSAYIHDSNSAYSPLSWDQFRMNSVWLLRFITKTRSFLILLNLMISKADTGTCIQDPVWDSFVLISYLHSLHPLVLSPSGSSGTRRPTTSRQRPCSSPTCWRSWTESERTSRTSYRGTTWRSSSSSCRCVAFTSTSCHAPPGSVATGQLSAVTQIQQQGLFWFLVRTVVAGLQKSPISDVTSSAEVLILPIKTFQFWVIME